MIKAFKMWKINRLSSLQACGLLLVSCGGNFRCLAYSLVAKVRRGKRKSMPWFVPRIYVFAVDCSCIVVCSHVVLYYTVYVVCLRWCKRIRPAYRDRIYWVGVLLADCVRACSFFGRVFRLANILFHFICLYFLCCSDKLTSRTRFLASLLAYRSVQLLDRRAWARVVVTLTISSPTIGSFMDSQSLFCVIIPCRLVTHAVIPRVLLLISCSKVWKFRLGVPSKDKLRSLKFLSKLMVAYVWILFWVSRVHL